MTIEETLSSAPIDFIRAIVAEDLKNGKNNGKVVTRFPPEPNGYLHIGHAKAICVDFGIAAENNGITHLRMDDTNPTKEDLEYVENIKNDVKWLGFDWKDKLFFASDYYEQLYNYAIDLIKMRKAFVCDLSADDVKAYRGSLTEPGKESPYRNRSIAENIDLFTRMRAGEYPDGARTLRAKIDMTSPNMHMRDPAIYRIRREHHYRTGNTWCIYPMYDFAHCLSDSIEGITHSICTLEFEIHRPLYDWFIVQLGLKSHPQQIEFARLNLTNTIMSKRKLLELVKNNNVKGWDDPRMPTLCGMRRRGYTPEAIRTFVESTGVTKNNAVFDIALLEHYLRDDLNKRARRVMAVLNPLKVVITNFPKNEVDELDAINNPEDESAGSRKISFTRELYIESDDFMEEPPKKFFRLAPGNEVRLRYGYFIKCEEIIKDTNGKIIELRCTYDPATRGGTSPDGRKVKGTIHWVSATHGANAEVRLYDHLFTVENPAESALELKDLLNPNSLTVIEAKIERSLLDAEPGMLFQFERIGYFCCDPDSTPERRVFNRSMTLKDSWSKIQKKENTK